MAHVHTDDAARRCAELGIRTVEHGTDIKADTAAVLAQTKTYVVPTLSVGRVLRDHGERIGIPPLGLKKINGVASVTAQSITNCIEAGVRLGLGADLLGHEFHPYQGGELALRGEFQKPIDVLRSATTINAEIVQMECKLGCIAPGALSDIIVVDGNPLDDLALFRDPANIPLVLRGNRMVRNQI